MGRRRLVVMLALVLGHLVGPTRPVVADDDIEMEGEAPPPPPPPPQPPPQDPVDPPTDPDAVVKDPKLAKKWRDTGVLLVQKGDAATRAKKFDDAKISYGNAVTAFEKAIEASDDASLYFDLAQVEEKLERLAAATTHYRTLLKATGLKPDVVKKATARFEELSTKIGFVTLVVKPEGATIGLAGKDLGTAPLPESLALMPGTYTFTLAAEGHQPKDVELNVEAGSESERTIELDKIEIIVQPLDPNLDREQPIEKPIEAAGPSRRMLYIGAGVTGGLALIATITGISAVSKHSTFADENATPQARADAKDSGKTLALVTDLCLVGALASGGFTAYWYFVKYRPSQRKLAAERAAKLEVVPWVKPDSGGFVVAGSF